MKVAMYVPLDLNAPGGVEKHVLRLGEQLRRLGVAADVFGKVGRNGNQALGPPLEGGDESNKEEFLPLSALKSGDYDILHTHSGFYRLTDFCGQWRRRPGQRWVHTLHTVSVDYWLNCRAWLNWRCYLASLVEAAWGHYADRVIAVSGHIRANARRFYHVPAERIAVIPNGYSPRGYPPTARAEVRERLGLTPGHVAILFVGRGEDRVKGTELIAAAVGRLYAKYPQVRLLALPGTGFRSAPWLISTGPIRHDETGRYYLAADIFVNASLSEGMPLTVVEAMAAGRAMVAARAGGIPEVIGHERNGLLLRPDRADLAGQLERLITDPELRARLGGQAQIDARELTWENLARRTLGIYETSLRN